MERHLPPISHLSTTYLPISLIHNLLIIPAKIFLTILFNNNSGPIITETYFQRLSSQIITIIILTPIKLVYRKRCKSFNNGKLLPEL